MHDESDDAYDDYYGCTQQPLVQVFPLCFMVSYKILGLPVFRYILTLYVANRSICSTFRQCHGGMVIIDGFRVQYSMLHLLLKHWRLSPGSGLTPGLVTLIDFITINIAMNES